MIYLMIYLVIYFYVIGLIFTASVLMDKKKTKKKIWAFLFSTFWPLLMPLIIFSIMLQRIKSTEEDNP